MRHPIHTTLALAVVLFLVAGCSSLTSPKVVTEFQWTEVEDPTTMVEGVQTTTAFGELFILGQMQTPGRCYSLAFNFDPGGSRLTLKVNARPNATSCDQGIGGYRYTLSVYNLKSGTYELTVIHDVTGADGGVYTKSITVT